MTTLVTGNAGFIGYHTAYRLLASGHSVVGIDSMNTYYDVSLKEARLSQLREFAHQRGVDYRQYEINIADRESLDQCFSRFRFRRVIHLAAQAGVRYSLEQPQLYVDSNVTGFLNILECCRQAAVPHLTYASSSSVYGANRKLPFSESDGVDHPLSMYAVTKRSNELMAHAYSHLYNLPVTGLRFFTVYGPWGRPDMALFLFTKKILEGTPIQVFNGGHHTRDFTFVDDIVEGILRVSESVATASDQWAADTPDPARSNAPYRIFNIGNSSPVRLMEYIRAIEVALGRQAEVEFLPMQPGDVEDTYADVSMLQEAVNYRPSTPIQVGVQKFVDWYKGYYNA